MSSKHFENRLRVRVCGIHTTSEGILLAQHTGITAGGFWCPPGGGVIFGESLKAALKREMMEECGLKVNVGALLAIHEFLQQPLHGIEFFFAVEADGTAVTGYDPELAPEAQIIVNVRHLSFADINKLPAAQLHPILHGISNAADLYRSLRVLLKS
jgi:8-oxo-dGTP diphosphatase